MEEKFINIIRKYLLQDEKILWSGKSEIKKVFEKSDIILIPISIIWTGIVFNIVKKTFDKNIFGLVSILFVFVALYLTIVRFIVKAYDKNKILYVVTDKRILVIKVRTTEKVISKYINQINSINISVSKSGIGTIAFGERSIFNKLYGNTYFDLGGNDYSDGIPIFYDISNAKKVHDIVNELRKKN